MVWPEGIHGILLGIEVNMVGKQVVDCDRIGENGYRNIFFKFLG